MGASLRGVWASVALWRSVASPRKATVKHKAKSSNERCASGSVFPRRTGSCIYGRNNSGHGYVPGKVGKKYPLAFPHESPSSEYSSQKACRTPPVRGKGRSPPVCGCENVTFFRPDSADSGQVLKGGLSCLLTIPGLRPKNKLRHSPCRPTPTCAT